jgi:hypothetical protein
MAGSKNTKRLRGQIKAPQANDGPTVIRFLSASGNVSMTIASGVPLSHDRGSDYTYESRPASNLSSAPHAVRGGRSVGRAYAVGDLD